MVTTQESEIIITFPKVRDNLIRYWWIIFIGILLGIAAIIWSDSDQGPERSQAFSSEQVFCFEENEENIDTRIYLATTEEDHVKKLERLDLVV